MEAAARPEAGVQQTQFAHIGRVVTDEGTFEVATQSRVTAGMMAPRGRPMRLLLFDSVGKLVSSYEAAFFKAGVPLWCEGARVYLWGFSSWNVSDTFNGRSRSAHSRASRKVSLRKSISRFSHRKRAGFSARTHKADADTGEAVR